MRGMDSAAGTLRRLRWLLAPLSVLYGWAIRARNARFDRSPRASHPADLPVISIGNITVGGTGKTPLVIETVRRLQRLGRRPAILTRGYGAAAGQIPDEAKEFSDALPNVPVVIDPDRVAAAATARADLAADCVVVDDGFQHRRLRRDLDVVVIDALDPWGGGWVLPAGRLREPLSSLARADLFIVSRANQVAPSVMSQIESVLARRAPRARVCRATVEPESIVYHDARIEDAEALAYHCVLPVCGLGNPTTFQRLVETLAGRVCPPIVFRDHQRYTPRHVRRVTRAAERRGADLVVTTRKDWVKLAPLWSRCAVSAAPELVRLDVRLALQDDEDLFDSRLRRAVEERR
jgi:tetraacyldisaccharide 4'-kinase